MSVDCVPFHVSGILGRDAVVRYIGFLGESSDVLATSLITRRFHRASR